MKLNKYLFVLIIILLFATFLRLYKIDKNPVSLFGDELDVGYQAYSILKTGRDYLGNFMPIHFQSLAEWRTPLYIYSCVPTIAVFGISPLGIRLPAAFFGILSVLVSYLLVKEIAGKEKIGLLSALILAISPWYLQYSRAGFEVTEMIFFLLLGIFFFLKGLKSSKFLLWSALSLALMPWTYSTAKLFLPLIILCLIVIWWRELKKIPKLKLIIPAAVFFVITEIFILSTIFGGGLQRIGEISILNDSRAIPQIESDRLDDIDFTRKTSQQITIADKIFHNKFNYFASIFISNYLQSFSTDFLFIKGDFINLRQSSGFELYKIDFIFIFLGLIFLITSDINKKIKIFLILWLLIAPIPSSFTEGGGNHATRLILMMPVLIILVTFGIYFSYIKINKRFKVLFAIIIFIIYLVSLLFYQHDYWIHYPFRSERWWQAGYEEAIKSALKESEKYNKVIISSADEPSLKFFLGWSMYSPSDFQKEYNAYISRGLNSNSALMLGKFEFPPIGQGHSLYELGSKLPDKTLYLATVKEVGLDLIKEPERLPSDLNLIKNIKYPSGKPAFYLFDKGKK